MKKQLAIGLGLVLAASSAAAQPRGIEGRWMSKGGMIQVVPCGRGPALCVNVLSGSDAPESMSDIIGQTVVRDLVRDNRGAWRGRYVADGKDLPTIITPNGNSTASFRVCLVSWIPLSCQTEQVTRVAQQG